jgi:hypothetical protein
MESFFVLLFPKFWVKPYHEKGFVSGVEIGILRRKYESQPSGLTFCAENMNLNRED